MILAVALNPSLDRTLVINQLEPGNIHRPDTVVQVAGGKGFNVARAAHRLGSDVVAIGILGGATGDVVRRSLSAEGVMVATVNGSAETRTCTSVASRATGDLTEFYEAGAHVTAAEWALLERKIRDHARVGSWLTLSGSVPPGAPSGALASLVNLGHELGLMVAVDTHGDGLSDAVRAAPHLVKVNEFEAATLLGRNGQRAVDSAPALQSMLDDGGIAIVTAGAAGAWAHDGTLQHVSAQQRGTYPVGSGDCFLAGLISAYDTGADLGDALKLAAAAGTANALQPGAATFVRAVVDGLAARMDVQEVSL